MKRDMPRQYSSYKLISMKKSQVEAGKPRENLLVSLN